ncbi:MAG: site-specific tyrosine recombinase XerD [Clostridiales bacterium GWF2_36_10]|nr:MAG: site-specific tyrosine recombinase XerD [Clostridiales bacterium GWF2_36_10]HAN21053.1 site-specific tyrosine recombinase XerD [Clostridiales bacterium]
MTSGVIEKNIYLQFNNFLSYLKDVKKSSDNTLQAYERDLSKFLEYARNNSLSSFSEVDSDDVSSYKQYLSEIGLSPSSVSRSLSALRSLFQYLIVSGEVEHNPAREIPNDKFEKKGPQVLTSKEIELLLSQPSQDDVKGIRDKAMLELLYATGIKVTEIINLNLEDINLQLSFIRCGNENKERFIPLYPIAVKSLASYIEKARKLLVLHMDEPALFVNVAGERMTRQGFWKILKNYAESAKIFKDITPHTLRHSFAAHLLENGADIHDIKEILGHSDISSTQRYAQFLKNKMKSGYMKYHPRA